MAIGKVIKGDGFVEPTSSTDRSNVERRRGGVVNAEVFDAHQEAQSIIETAHRRAAEILEEAKRQREKVLQEGREAGRQEGLAEVSKTWAQNHLLRGKLMAEAESQVVQLALEIAEKIIGKDLERDPNLVVDICATAIDGVRNAQQMLLRVNPQDAAILKERRKQMMELLGRVKDIGIKEDADVAKGGCVIETDAGTIDAQLSTQLEMLLNVLVPDTARKDGPR